MLWSHYLEDSEGFLRLPGVDLLVDAVVPRDELLLLGPTMLLLLLLLFRLLFVVIFDKCTKLSSVPRMK